MIKGIMLMKKEELAKEKSMPWPKNSIDLKWFKENTINNIVIMGKHGKILCTPLKSRTNIVYGADLCISGDIKQQITN